MDRSSLKLPGSLMAKRKWSNNRWRHRDAAIPQFPHIESVIDAADSKWVDAGYGLLTPAAIIASHGVDHINDLFQSVEHYTPEMFGTVSQSIALRSVRRRAIEQ